MGTDIHGVWQAKDKETNTWIDIPSDYEQHRHYQLFAVLANVRNGYGFAGIKTGDAVEPIAMPRGLPSDFVVDNENDHPFRSLEVMDPRRRSYREQYPNDYKDEPLGMWMGDHSYSWLTGEEMLAWYANPPVVAKVGVISRERFKYWEGDEPDNYSGEIRGGGIIVTDYHIPEKDRPKGWTHIRVGWSQSLGKELAYFFDEVKKLVSIYGEIRFVFGFDS